MNAITPDDTSSPKRISSFLLGVLDILFDKNAKKPGKSGRTQTAVKGVKSPKTNAVPIFARKLTILS